MAHLGHRCSVKVDDKIAAWSTTMHDSREVIVCRSDEKNDVNAYSVYESSIAAMHSIIKVATALLDCTTFPRWTTFAQSHRIEHPTSAR